MFVVIVEFELKIFDVVFIVSDQKLFVLKFGWKIKGRGIICYYIFLRLRFCFELDDDDSSEIFFYWKEEMQRLRVYRLFSGEKWSKGDKLSDFCLS